MGDIQGHGRIVFIVLMLIADPRLMKRCCDSRPRKPAGLEGLYNLWHFGNGEPLFLNHERSAAELPKLGGD